MTREQAFKDINETQDYYVNELIKKLHDPRYNYMKKISFCSPTGTGKTKMIAKLINKLPNYYFIVTSLSRGGLYNQIAENLRDDCIYDNYVVYGVDSLKNNTHLTKEHILNIINTKIAEGKTCIWIKDEGHRETNNWEFLVNICFKTILFSATLANPDIRCNFTHTMMLRQVEQLTGTPEDAILKLIEVKNQHRNVPNYNPCAIFRCVKNRVRKNNSNDEYDFENDEYDINMVELVISLCNKYKLSYRYIVGGQQDIVRDLCNDDNDCDVIINKFVITEGIDIRRACVVYLDNIPGNVATTIQVIGRCRRNALLYNYDTTNVDILDIKNAKLLEDTRICYAFYNASMSLDTDENAELTMAFCSKISCQSLKADTEIDVVKGKLSNGYEILELNSMTGRFHIIKDNVTGFNVIKEIVPVYQHRINNKQELARVGRHSNGYVYVDVNDLYTKLPWILIPTKTDYNYATMCKKYKYVTYAQLYDYDEELDSLPVKDGVINYFINCIDEHKLNLSNIINSISVDTSVPDYVGTIECTEYLNQFIKDYANCRGYKEFCNWILSELISVNINPLYRPLCNIIAYYCCNNYKKNTWITRMYNNQFYEVIPKLLSYCISSGLTIDVVNKLCWIIFNKEDYIVNCVKKVPEVQDIITHNRNLIINKNITWDYLHESESVYLLRYYGIQYKKYKNITQQHIVTIDTYGSFSRCVKDDNIYLPYTLIFNDYESTLIGLDRMRYISINKVRSEYSWVEDKCVTNKLCTPTKLSAYIDVVYKTELEYADSYLTTNKLKTGKNNFNFDNTCNRMLGYCVEYYTKYLLYGVDYLDFYIKEARKESCVWADLDSIDKAPLVIRACMLKYLKDMQRVFGDNWKKHFKYISVSIQKLVTDKYKEFVNTVVTLSERAVDFIRTSLYPNGNVTNNIDPNLSVKHIMGLADFITPDTILDIKVTNHINKNMIRQVLAYHYLSTKRSDLNIKRVIVYDATLGKSITVNIDPKNYNKNFDENGNVIMSERLVRKEMELTI